VEGAGPLESGAPRSSRVRELVVIVGLAIIGLPIAAAREYRVSIFSRVVDDPVHASPVSSVGGIAIAFVRGEFREYT
jgi:hypothetical protein